MKVCPDTNILVRAVVQPANAQDQHQARRAQAVLRSADQIVLTLPALCEMAWVLRSAYRTPSASVASTIRTLIGAGNVACDRAAIDGGLRVLEAGGDFADGAIAQSGFLAGADLFVSFDKRAVRLLAKLGHAASEPA